MDFGATGSSSRQQPSFTPRYVITMSQLTAKEKEKIYCLMIANNSTMRKNSDGQYLCDVRILAPKVKKSEFIVTNDSSTNPDDTSGALATLHNAFPIEERLRIMNERMFIEVTIVGVPEFHYNTYTRFVGLIANHKQTVKPKQRLVAWLMKTIEDIYDARFIYEKHDVDRDDEASVTNPLIAIFPAFVVRRLSTVMGLRAIVEQTCWDLVYNVNLYRGEYIEVEMFARFLQEFYDQDDLLFFLYVRSVISQLLKISFKARWTKPETAAKILNKPFCLSYRECILVAKNIFGAENDHMVKDLLAIIIPELVGQKTATSDTRRIDICQFLHLAVVAYHQTQYQASQDNLSLHSSSQASTNQTGSSRMGFGGNNFNGASNMGMDLPNQMNETFPPPPQNNKGPVVPSLPPSAPSTGVYMSKYRPDLDMEAKVVSSLAVDSYTPSYTPSLRAYANPIGMFRSEMTDNPASKPESFSIDRELQKSSDRFIETSVNMDLFKSDDSVMKEFQNLISENISLSEELQLAPTGIINNDNNKFNNSNIANNEETTKVINTNSDINLANKTTEITAFETLKPIVHIDDFSIDNLNFNESSPSVVEVAQVNSDSKSNTSNSDLSKLVPVQTEVKVDEKVEKSIPVIPAAEVEVAPITTKNVIKLEPPESKNNDLVTVSENKGTAEILQSNNDSAKKHQEPLKVSDIISKFEKNNHPLDQKPASLQSFIEHPQEQHGDVHFHHVHEMASSAVQPGPVQSGATSHQSQENLKQEDENQENQENQNEDFGASTVDEDVSGVPLTQLTGEEGEDEVYNNNEIQSGNEIEDEAAVYMELQIQRESEFLSFLCEPIGGGEYSVEVVDFVVEHLAAALRTHINDAIALISDQITSAAAYDEALVGLLEADNVAVGFIEYRNELIQHKLDEIQQGAEQ